MPIRPVIVLSAMLLVSPFSFAQSEAPSPFATVDAAEYAQSIVDSYMLQGSSNKTAIPDFVYYQFVYSDILRAQPEDIGSSDIALLMNAPSTRNYEFNEAVYTGTEQVCAGLDAARSDDAIAQLGNRVSAIIRNHETLLSDHYRAFTARLSPDGQQRIHARIEKLKASDQVAYSTLDMSGLAANEPAVAAPLLQRSCETFEGLNMNDLRNVDMRMVDEYVEATALKFPNR